MTTLRAIAGTRLAPAGSRRERHDLLPLFTAGQHLHPPLRLVEDLRAATGKSHALLEGGERLLEAEAPRFELLDDGAQPLQHLVEATIAGPCVLRRIGH